MRGAILSLLAVVAGLAGCDRARGQTDAAFTATGELIALSGGAGGAANACFTCHGLNGEGDGDAAPRLAGLDAGYLHKQLDDYATGRRPDDAMSGIARALNGDDRRAVAAFYAEMAAPGDVGPAAQTAADAEAPGIYALGDAARGVTACAACHGAQGEGGGPGNPVLAGQPAAYTVEQIDRWRDGRRRNDPRGVMARAVAPLTDAEAHAIADWLSTRPIAPSPANAGPSESVAAAAAARPAASREARRPDRSDGASAPRPRGSE